MWIVVPVAVAATAVPAAYGKYVTLFLTVGKAPAQSSSRTTRTWPPAAARCSDVLPACGTRTALLVSSVRIVG
jgi:hypothetical protein